MLKLRHLTLAVMIAASFGGCGTDGSSNGSTGDTVVNANSAEEALKSAGFRVSRSPLMAGSGIEGIIFVDLTADERVEVSVFESLEAAEAFADGMRDANQTVTLVRNMIISGGSGVDKDGQQRILTILRSADSSAVLEALSGFEAVQRAIPTEVVVDGEYLWIRTLKEPYLWLREEPTGAVRPVRMAHPVVDVFVGAGRAWAISTDPLAREARAVLVDADARVISDVGLPNDCEPAGGAVFEEDLWLHCGDSLLRVRPTGQTETVRREEPSPLLSTPRGLWLVSRENLTLIAGDSHHQSVPLSYPDAVAWTAYGTAAWALDETEDGSILVRVDLITGKEEALPVDTGVAFPLRLAVVGADVWVSTDAGTVLYFRPAESSLPVELADFADTSDDASVVDVAGDPAGIWAVVLRSDTEIVRINK